MTYAHWKFTYSVHEITKKLSFLFLTYNVGRELVDQVHLTVFFFFIIYYILIYYRTLFCLYWKWDCDPGLRQHKVFFAQINFYSSRTTDYNIIFSRLNSWRDAIESCQGSSISGARGSPLPVAFGNWPWVLRLIRKYKTRHRGVPI